MRIDNNNYESWFLDYHEGNLNANQRAAVMAFLDKNPDLHDVFYAFESIRIEKSSVADEVYPCRDELYKSDSLSAWNVQEWLVAALEGDLEVSQQQELERFITQNPSLLHEQELLARTRLKADTSEVYEGKSKLRHAEVIRLRSYTRILRYAAILLLLAVSAYTIRKLANDKPYTVFANEQGRTSPKPMPARENDTLSDKAVALVSAASESGGSASVAKGSKTEKPQRSKTEVALRGVKKIGPIEAMPKRPIHLTDLINESQPLYATSHESTTSAWMPFAGDGDTHALDQEQLRDEILGASFDGLTAEAGNAEIHKAAEPSRLPLFSRILRYTAKSVSRISGNRIQVRTLFNPITGHIAACEVETETRSWQKHF